MRWPGVCSGIGIEFQGCLRGGVGIGQLPLVDVNRPRASRVNVPVLVTRHRDRDELQVEPAGDRSRKHRERFAALCHHQDIATEIEQARELVAAPDRFFRPVAGHSRQVARDQTHHEERKQRHPVVGIRDGERANRRQEEEIETEHRGDGRRDGHSQSRRGRHQQNDHTGR